MDEALTVVQETVRQILLGIGVQKVVSIDDYYSSGHAQYEDAIGLFHLARNNRDVGYSGAIPKEILDAPEDIWTRMLNKTWSEVEAVRRTAILDELSQTFTQELPTRDVRDLSLLKRFVPGHMLVVVGPEEWERRRDEILAVARDDYRVLCLFDQDLSLAGLSEDAGMTLIQQTLSSFGDGHVICGLLTQKIEKDAELPAAREFAATFGLSLDRFLPLSKQRLRSDNLEFADGLKMLALNHARERLSKQVVELTRLADEAAHGMMNQIDVEDFEHIVVRSSEMEGVWETDTLFRLFELFRHNSFRSMVLDPDRRSSLFGDIERIRAIRDIRVSDHRASHPSDQVYRIRRSELFDTEQLLNPAHLPIELGDIFKVGPSKHFILLAQPCDLMIRSKSSLVDIVTLVQVQSYEPTSKNPDGISSFRLDYFEAEPGKRTFVKFRNAFKISRNVLDLAVLNDDGLCRMVLAEVADARISAFHAPWQGRIKKLREEYRKAHEEFRKIPYHQASQYQKKALRHLLLCSNLNVDLRYDPSGSFEFGIQRVGRCRASLSIQVLGAYSSFLSRNPQQHDFARPLQDYSDEMLDQRPG